ncbi:chondroitin sulfate glucuronyltransferase-like [Paramacrobiotus metropolitanus]|uniref:chondroitin sulfate glucuronyltransferase-like n=1 Tax=Paramacrobiotus metropolitanus TaxID=2943436 RepID=UPI0024457770|nr:chondroitin sulfate glucuronyltransferase-like [Paramacrobiotus metropolitanus]XP_055329225.1 chondroitin sulfate glucuronyltransferase-like [Paramacrobiotus metropolitanus]XP_055329227.1 chondroitin sulfate glucuronyltransferase-like [Paramacrobiotus metropolitanus]XP_055329228.1 chondroitin sulfate glucuronyltransferase-like [Paramacrobiotus metropolitanus]XP_055329229.1 chondroitin sulfate glucuronyltransferase-like [Paramacrobiotus metropolitanus]XP_055329230.1 chondroitin sulfate glucu
MAGLRFESLRRLWQRHPEILVGFCLGITCGIYHCMDNLTTGSPVPCHTPTNGKESGLPKALHSVDDDYDPVILYSEMKSSPEVQPAYIPARPRYYSSELGIHEPLFVAISSSVSTLSSLGIALNQTSAAYLPRLSFFINTASEPQLQSYQNLSMHVVQISDAGVRVKPLSIVQFLINNQYIDNYDWFFIVPDSTYIRAKKLMEYVRKTSAGHDNYIGEMAKKDSPSFCLFESGVLLSQSVMKRISETLPSCMEDADSDPTAAVGKCVEKATNLHCNDNYGQAFSGYRINEKQSLADQDNTAQLIESSEPIRSAVTVYPLTAPEHFFRLHLELNRNEISELTSVIEDLQDDIVKQSPSTPSQGRDLQWPIGSNHPSLAKNRFDLVEWTYFNSTHLFRPDDFQVTEKLCGANVKDIEQLTADLAKKMEEMHSHENIKFVKLLHGYRKFDPTRGMEYLLDLIFQAEGDDTGSEGKIIKKRIRMLKALGKMEVVGMPFVTEATRVHVVLPVNPAEVNASLIFLERFSRHLLEEQENVFLMMVFIYGPNDPGKGDPNDAFLVVKQEAKQIEKRFNKLLGTRLGWVSIRNPLKAPPSDFAVMDLVSKKFSKDSIILRTSFQALLNGEFLNRVRLSTIAGTQVYFPIPVAQYNENFIPKNMRSFSETFDVKRQVGYFDKDSTETAAFYIMDYTSARKGVLDAWPLILADRDLGKESPRPYREGLAYNLFTLFIGSDLHVFRGIEPMLKIKFSIKDCDTHALHANQHEYDICVKRQHESLAGKQQLALSVLTDV